MTEAKMTTGTCECKGHIITKVGYRAGSSKDYAVAVLVELLDGSEEVLSFSGSGHFYSGSLAVCKVGHKVTVSLHRNAPENPWTIQRFTIDYDIVREKAALCKLLGQ